MHLFQTILFNAWRGWREMPPLRKVRQVVMIGLLFFGLWALTPYLYNREVNEDFPVSAPVVMAPCPPMYFPHHLH